MTNGSFDSLDVPRFSRRWWGGAARTLLPVMLVTTLIWVYADLEFTDTEEFSAKIRLTVAKAKGLELLSGSTLPVTFTLRGNRSGLDAFRGRLAERDAPLTFDVSAGHGPGRHPLRTADVLAAAAGLDEAGLSVLAAAPSVIHVWLDRQIHVQVPVEFVYSNAALAEPPKLTMGVRVAVSNWSEILRAHPKPTLKTANVDLKDQPSGKPIPVVAAVVAFIGNVAVQPDEETIRFTVEITRRTAARTIDVTVLVMTPPDWPDTWRQYDLVRKDPLEWRPKITVRGAKRDIEKLRPEDVLACVVLTETDKEPVSSWLEREVQIRLPRGLQLELTGQRPKVSFKLQKRPAATEP